VTGVVKLNGLPVSGAVVSFHPDGETTGLGGFGRTDSDGRYILKPRRSKINPGEYRVVVSIRLNPDGSTPDPDVPPIDSDAIESLPAIYSDLEQTTLRAKIGENGTGEFPFELTLPNS